MESAEPAPRDENCAGGGRGKRSKSYDIEKGETLCARAVLSKEALKEHTSRFGERYRSDRGGGGVLVEDDKLEVDFIVVDQTLTLPSSPVTIV
jgi:hypothetical protein